MATKTKKAQAQALTDTAIKAMKPDAVAYRMLDLRCRGLSIRIATNGGKTWELAYRIKGAGGKHVSLGRYEDVSLETARRRANELTSAARQSVDLIADEAAKRDEHKQSFTVERLISEYLKRRVTGRLRTADELERRLKRALKPMMERKAADIRRRDLRNLLDAVADQGLKREAGQRRQAIGAMFKWALSQDIVESNPADGLSPYGLGTPRDRVLSENEIRLLWRWLDDSQNISTGVSDILKLQLCLGARVSEIAGMRASEFAKDDKGRLLWTLPEARAKNERARVTPILGLALDILSARASEDVLFASETGNPHYSGSVGQQLRARWDRLPIDRFRTHDLRRTVATMMVAQLKLPLELVAIVVGHTVGGSQTQTLVRNYVHDQFVDRKAGALAQWDRRLRQILAGEAGKVVAFEYNRTHTKNVRGEDHTHKM
jgi:integrase